MPRPRLKICGLRQPAQAAAVALLGADAIGVIGVAGSPRYVDPAERQGLFAAVQAAAPGCQRVLVVADPDGATLAQLGADRGHGILQLHGSESPQRCRELGEKLGCEVWKALRIRSPEDLQRAAAYAEVVEALLHTMLQDADSTVRDEARLALEQLEQPEVLEKLQTLVDEGLLS